MAALADCLKLNPRPLQVHMLPAALRHQRPRKQAQDIAGNIQMANDVIDKDAEDREWEDGLQ
jgi:hypothetical protein